MATLLVFVLMMSQHPDILEKTQDEMTRVVGRSRLPDFEDREALPYLECVLREAYRYGATLNVPCIVLTKFPTAWPSLCPAIPSLLDYPEVHCCFS